MSTKAVGQNVRQDVTTEYKYKEGSPEERASHGSDPNGDIQFSLQVAQAKLGQPIHAKLNINPAKGGGTIQVRFSAHIVTYTGKPVSALVQTNTIVNATQGTPISVPFTLSPDVYVPHLKGTNGIVFRVYSWVKESDQSSIVQEEFEFVDDDLEIVVDKNLRVGADAEATIKFPNPLSIALNNLVLTVEGTDLTKVQRFQFPSVAPHQTLTQKVQLHAWSAGKKLLIAMLDSDEVNDLRGHVEITVTA